MSKILRSAKCCTFRVAKVACRASAIPAICVSRMSTGRPVFCRAAANDAAAVAAAVSKSNTRFSRSSCSSRSNADSSAWRRRPDGSKGQTETGLEHCNASQPDGVSRPAIQPHNHRRVWYRAHQRAQYVGIKDDYSLPSFAASDA
jgi:hypothetical protein